MSGYTARLGFHYQDLYLLYRVLRDASDSLDHAWQMGLTDVLQAIGKSDIRYGIEASSSFAGKVADTSSNVCDWDVLVLTKRKLEFAEVKSGVISKDDRVTFWCRLRHELANRDNETMDLVPILVVDPTVSGDLSKWEEIPLAVSAYNGSPPSIEPTNNVLNNVHLLAEALWWLCRADDDQNDPPVSTVFALKALSRLEVHRHEAEQLSSSVTQLIDILFPGGLTETGQTLLLGWLNNRATNSMPQRRLFTIHELLAEIGIFEQAVTLRTGILKEWGDLWNEVPQAIQARTHLQLGEKGESFSAATVQPRALDNLNSGKSNALVILGQGGAGKSTFIAQAAQAARQNGDIVLHCGADDVSVDELESLVKAFRFRAAILAVTSPNTRVSFFVDGLDETDGALRKRWGQLLARLKTLPNVLLFISVREASWNADGDLRANLRAWLCVTLSLWPEKLVRDLLSQTPYNEILQQSAIELLRTPILLDLFWRTFIESTTSDISLAARLQTRQNLLAAYWEQRLIHSPRYTSVRDLHNRLGGVFSKAANHIGYFSESDADFEIVSVLLSEGIFVREGRLQPRLRFRHPLLRDFAFAQWCLTTGKPNEVTQRWNSIQGGLQQYGALRAIFDALLDQNARDEYPSLELANILQVIIKTDASSASRIAQVLGTHEPAKGLDPSQWPPDIQLSLPTQFGHDLLAAARFGKNGLWASRLEFWSDDLVWLNKDYPGEVLNYATILFEICKSNPADQQLCERCRQASRKLRQLSEVERFSSDFSENDRWLKAQAIKFVPLVLPDEVTLAWVEREIAQPSWRTRTEVFERLIFLAPIDAARTVAIYRQAVRLAKNNGRHVLLQPLQGGVIDYQAIEWSLAGEGEHRGLLKEYPVAFLPVALELAEALWHDKECDRQTDASGMSEFIKQFDPEWSEVATAEYELTRQELLKGLIDDSLEWSYWRSMPKYHTHERCLRAIHECAERCAHSGPVEFLSLIVPIMCSSRLASVHSILLEVLLKRKGKRSFENCVLERLLDSRLYHVSGIEFWLEQGLITCWPFAQPDERAKLLETIKTLLGTPGEEHNAKNFLLRLPIGDLPDDLKKERPTGDDPSHHPYSRPSPAQINVEGVSIKEDDERAIGRWPGDFDREVLLQFVRATRQLPPQNPTVGDLTEKVYAAIKAAQPLVAMLRDRGELLVEADHFWVWKELTRIFECFRNLQGERSSPPERLLLDCTDVALSILRNIPLDLPGELEENGLDHYNETAWTCALRLANVVLTWPPIAHDQKIQQEFLQIIKVAFETGRPMVQFVCTVTIYPWHWFQNSERRQLHDRLFWTLVSNARVLTHSLNRTAHYSDGERVMIFKLLLNRTNIENPKELANRLGQHVGVGGMIIYDNGQRSAIADLAREVIETPTTYRLLQDRTNRYEFFRNFAFGMKEQAKLMWSRTELAADFGYWAVEIWRLLGSDRQRRGESENVILFTLHWLKKSDRELRDIAKLALWWQHLQALIKAVVTEGGRPDCFMLFFILCEGQCNDLGIPEELISAADLFTDRLQNGLKNGSMKPDEVDNEHEDRHSWREVSHFLAETIGSLRKDGLLQTDIQREQAYRILSRLAAEPIGSLKAVEILHRLQNE